MSNPLRPHGPQCVRLPCPPLSPGVCSNSCLLSDAIQLSHSLSSPSPPCPQSFPASGSFPMSQLFTSGGQSIRASALTSVFPLNIQGWFPLEWTGLIFFQSKELLRVFSSTTIRKHSVLSLLHCPALTSVHSMWSSTFFFFSFFLI